MKIELQIVDFLEKELKLLEAEFILIDALKPNQEDFNSFLKKYVKSKDVENLKGLQIIDKFYSKLNTSSFQFGILIGKVDSLKKISGFLDNIVD